MARRAALAILVTIALFCIWWYFASDYDYSALAGTYRFHEGSVSCTLLLRSNQTFHQEVISGKSLLKADGSWHRFGEAGVSFSSDFLRVPGAKTFIEEFGTGYGNKEDNDFDGTFEKLVGLYPELRLNANPPGPKFYRSFFRR